MKSFCFYDYPLTGIPFIGYPLIAPNDWETGRYELGCQYSVADDPTECEMG